MEEFKGTKGDWKIEVENVFYFFLTNEKGERICDITSPHEDGLANGLLFLKSREMLQLLIDCKDLLHMFDNRLPTIEKIETLVKEVTEIHPNYSHLMK